MKHFIDIEHLREFDVDLGNDMVRRKNCDAFETGDTISITEKIDGSNASIRYNAETGKLDSFSHRQELTFSNTLDGFWNYVQTLNAEDYSDIPNLVIFGEWLRKNKIVYEKDNMHKWYVYSVYDTDKEKWLDQEAVKQLCKERNLTYVHELYYGPFVSWEHCRTFLDSPIYGKTQEGIVCRNITKLNSEDNRSPFILKIVNESFKESMVKTPRIVDPEVEAAKANAQALMESIVTEARVSKMLLKLRDEGLLPSEIGPKDMGIVAKNLPKRIYEDCMKEEREIMVACGEYAGKMAGSISMRIARELLLS